MMEDIELDIRRSGKTSSVEELRNTCPLPQDEELEKIADFIVSISYECPSRNFSVGLHDIEPSSIAFSVYVDNYTIYIVSSSEVRIEKGNTILSTTPQKVLELLRQSKSDYPYSPIVSLILRSVMLRLLQTIFYIDKADNSLLIEYHI